MQRKARILSIPKRKTEVAKIMNKPLVSRRFSAELTIFSSPRFNNLENIDGRLVSLSLLTRMLISKCMSTSISGARNNCKTVRIISVLTLKAFFFLDEPGFSLEYTFGSMSKENGSITYIMYIRLIDWNSLNEN